MAVNSVSVAGRLVADPELRETKSGTNVSQFTVAVDKFRKEDGANFFDVVAWGKPAEIISQYVTKGSYIVVNGNLEQQTWEQEGQKRSKVVINLRDFDLGPRVDGGGQSQAQPARPQPQNNGGGGIDLSEIPF